MAYFWAIAGLILCLMEVFLPSAFTESALGLSALLVAVLVALSAGWLPLWLQGLAWVGFSLGFLLLFRRLSHRRRPIEYVLDDQTAKTLTAIAAGQTGRVMYEGALWQARSADPAAAIAPDQPVQVVQKQGNVLIVLPLELLQ